MFLCVLYTGGPIRNAPYKKHFQNWQFDVSLLENFGKNVYLVQYFFKNFRKFFQNLPRPKKVKFPRILWDFPGLPRIF